MGIFLAGVGYGEEERVGMGSFPARRGGRFEKGSEADDYQERWDPQTQTLYSRLSKGLKLQVFTLRQSSLSQHTTFTLRMSTAVRRWDYKGGPGEV